MRKPRAPSRRNQGWDRSIWKTKAPATDDDGATFGEDGRKFIELFDGNFVVGIGEPDDGLGGQADGLADGAPFAVAAGPADHAQSRILQAQRLDNLAGAIVAIRCDNDLVGVAAILEVANCFTEGRGYAAGFVVRR